MAFLMDFARLSFFLNRDFEEAFFCGTHERKSSGKPLAALLIMWVQKVGHFNPIYTTLYHKLNIAKF